MLAGADETAIGDMIIDNDDLTVLKSPLSQRAVTGNERFKWPNGVVPYEFESNVSKWSKARFDRVKVINLWIK